MGLENQISHSDNAVHRRADFVAHVGQELTLRPVGRLGRLFRQLQLKPPCLTFGHQARNQLRESGHIHQAVLPMVFALRQQAGGNFLQRRQGLLARLQLLAQTVGGSLHQFESRAKLKRQIIDRNQGSPCFPIRLVAIKDTNLIKGTQPAPQGQPDQQQAAKQASHCQHNSGTNQMPQAFGNRSHRECETQDAIVLAANRDIPIDLVKLAGDALHQPIRSLWPGARQILALHHTTRQIDKNR